VIVCVRNPLEVALSLQHRGMLSYSLSTALWRTYNERILAATDTGQRLIVSYDRALDDQRGEVERVAEFLGVRATTRQLDAACASVRSTSRHWHLTLDDLRDANVPRDVAQLYVWMLEQAGGPHHARNAHRSSPMALVPRTRSDVVEAFPAPTGSSRIVDRKVVENEFLRTKVRTLQPELAARDRAICGLQADLEEARSALVVLAHERDTLARSVERSEGRLDELVRMVDALRGEVQRRGDETQEVLYELHGFETGIRERPVADGRSHAYRQSVDRIRQAVHEHVPRHATVLVASHGDDELLRLYGRRAWHFPGLADGTYVGYHPASSEAALVNLQALEALGATHLVLPAHMVWWLEHYSELARHLQRRCRLVYGHDDLCRVFSLLERPRGNAALEAEALEDFLADFRARHDHDPSVLDWDTTRDLARELPDLAVFTPPGRSDQLDYLDATVDVVAVTTGNEERLAEAHRVASVAVLAFADERDRTGARRYGAIPPQVEWLEQSASSLPSVTVVVPCYDGLDETRVCVESLARTLTGGLDVQVVMVDDASNDGTAAFLRRAEQEHAWLEVLRNPANVGYLASVNRGARAARGEILVFLNNDTILLRGWLAALLRTFRRFPECGAVGGRLLYPDGRVQEAGGIVFRDGSAAKFGAFDPAMTSPLYGFLRDVHYCSGALLATPRAVFEELGGFDAAYGPGYYEDTDYCFRVRATGRRVLYQPASTIVHVEGATAGRDVATGMKQHQVLNHRRFVERWHDVLAAHPERPPEPFDFVTLFDLAGVAVSARGGA
jgi:GT2 family glycosyltransferase